MLGSESEGEKSERESVWMWVDVSEFLEACNKGQTLKTSCGGRGGREGGRVEN